MEIEKKLELLEEMMELDGGTLKPETVLENLDEWDSLASLSLIVLLDEKFGKEIGGEDIKKLKTIQDILDIMC